MSGKATKTTQAPAAPASNALPEFTASESVYVKHLLRCCKTKPDIDFEMLREATGMGSIGGCSNKLDLLMKKLEGAGLEVLWRNKSGKQSAPATPAARKRKAPTKAKEDVTKQTDGDNDNTHDPAVADELDDTEAPPVKKPKKAAKKAAPKDTDNEEENDEAADGA